MAKRCKRVEQLELYHLQKRVPGWTTLPLRVREEVIENLIRMFRDRMEPCVASHEQEPGEPRHE
jgi:hypothetical protein